MGMRSAIAIALVFAASPVLADEAASALADCQAHQQRLEDLESNAMAPAQAAGSGTGWQPQRFGEDEIAHQRALTDDACAYARELRRKSGAPKMSANPTPPPSIQPFRSDEPPPSSQPPVFDEHPRLPAAQPPSPSPPPRKMVRRPPPAPQPSVGGTKARHPVDESQ